MKKSNLIAVLFLSVIISLFSNFSYAQYEEILVDDDTEDGILFYHSTLSTSKTRWYLSKRSNNQDFWIYNYDGSNYWIPLKFQYSASPKSMYIDANVAIGHESATEKLDVLGNLALRNSSSPSFLKLYTTSGTNNAIVFTDVNGTSFLRSYSGSSGYLEYNGNVRITNNGSLGIGTAPTEKLDVNGNASISGNIGVTNVTSSGYVTASSYLQAPVVKAGNEWFGFEPTANNWTGFNLSNGTGSQKRIILGVDNDEDRSVFAIEKINVWTRYMDIKANGSSYFLGNMAIGTSNINGTYKLSVNGKIRAKEVVVETGWSDFVFEEDYNLKSLKEVESFIKENKHLPDVPSEKEVTENGVSIGEMQSTLLQKIEELTLYVIEQDKRIEKLEQENAELKK